VESGCEPEHLPDNNQHTMANTQVPQRRSARRMARVDHTICPQCKARPHGATDSKYGRLGSTEDTEDPTSQYNITGWNAAGSACYRQDTMNGVHSWIFMETGISNQKETYAR